MASEPKELLGDLLKATSRSFYLTLRVLPAAVRPQIGLAYLLARTTDTIADTELVPVEQRLDALKRLREHILTSSTVPLNFGELAQHQGLPAERVLLEKAGDSLALLQTLSPDDLELVRTLLNTITGGQELDLRRFADASAEKIVALETAAELDDYTYRVAGCVGEFWTKMCRAHLFPKAKLNNSFAIEFGEHDPGVGKFFKQLDDSFLIQLSVRFGKGLQLVNILRDLPADLRKGRCYLPAEKLDAAGLQPAGLLLPANEAKFCLLYHHYLDAAEAHLAAGWAYTNSLPRRHMRVQQACAWPILIGLKTIKRLRAANVVELQQGVKISRAEVRGILVKSVLSYPLPGAWQKLFSPTGKAVASGGN
jgi:farnesyl-diphosphate farnesyltransferase